MKKIKLLLLFAVILFNVNTVKAFTTSYTYTDAGEFYTNTIIPASIPVNMAQEGQPNDSLSSADKKMDLYKLKRGEATKANILGLVEMGDAGIEKAAKNGNITKIYYVDSKKSKLYIPILFIPIYARATTTYVYGE